jgi:hypothetical protein
VVYVNVPREGEMTTRKESKEKSIVVDEERKKSSKPIPNLKNTSNNERKCAYVFWDGVAWEIVDKNIVQSCLIFLNKR